MVTCVNNLWLDFDGVALIVFDNGELLNIEAELIESLDSLGDSPALCFIKYFRGGELFPELVIFVDNALAHRIRVYILSLA